jgi:hypothetical protein
LILYALRAGEIGQQVRFEMLCSGDDENPTVNPTECRIRAARWLPTNSWSDRECETEKIEREWKSNIDGGLCRLVGTLILHHHWWYPYDPVAYELIRKLTDEQYAKRIYNLHYSCSPEYERKQSGKRERTQLELQTTLSEDIAQIISSYRNAGLDDQQQEGVHRAALVMIRQFCGQSVRWHGILDEDKNISVGSSLRSVPSRTEASAELRFLNYRREWEQDFKGAMVQSSPNYPIVKSSTLRDEKSSAPVYCPFVLSLLSPGKSPVARPNRSFGIRTDKRTVRISNRQFLVEEDKNGDREHFLYWHARAMLKLGPYILETEGEL